MGKKIHPTKEYIKLIFGYDQSKKKFFIAFCHDAKVKSEKASIPISDIFPQESFITFQTNEIELISEPEFVLQKYITDKYLAKISQDSNVTLEALTNLTPYEYKTSILCGLWKTTCVDVECSFE